MYEPATTSTSTANTAVEPRFSFRLLTKPSSVAAHTGFEPVYQP